MHLVFHFNFMEFHIDCHGRFLVAPLVFIVVVLFVLSKIVAVLLAKVFGKNFLVDLCRDKLTPKCNDILHPTLRLWHKWLAMTLFPGDNVRTVRVDEMRILYVVVRRIKVSPVQAMIRQWLTNFKMTGSIECTSLVLRIITSLGVTQGPNVPYIANPWSLIDEAYLTQGHILKKGPDDYFVFFYPRYANQIQLLNPDFRLYGQGLLIVPLEESRCSSVSSDRVTRSASRRATKVQQPRSQPSLQSLPEPHPQPTTPPPGTWTSTDYMPRVTPRYAPSWDQPMYQQRASSSTWASASSGE
jgi:hypothetical protein